MLFCFEGYNGIIKKTITFRERLPLGQFVQTVLDMTGSLSLEYKKNERVIATKPIISLKDWRLAGLWCKDENLMHISGGEQMVFHVPSSKAIEENWKLTDDNVFRIQTTNWETFDQFIDFGNGLYWTVHLCDENNDWSMKSKCDCPFFLKHYKCKHVIGMALRQRIAKLPRAAVSTLIGPKPKRGRKAKAQQALLTQ